MVTNESNVSILKNFIFKIAEQAYTSNDTFNNIKAGIVEEHLNGKYKVKLDGSDTLVDATLFYSGEQINQNDYVYLIEAFTEGNANFIKYFIFGKVNDVKTEIGKSDWSRFIEAGESGTKSSEWTWGTICNTPLIYDSSEDHKSFIDSINNNGYFAIYGDFTCTNTSENLKEYGLNITLTYEDDKPFVYKFSSQDFIGQPFNMTSAITQKKIFKIAKNIKSISIQGFVDGGSATISLSNLTIAAGSLYMLDPNIEVKVAAAAGTKEYFVGAEQEQIELQANITQNGQSVFSDLINYIWYINNPDRQETDEDYWKCLNGESVDEILTDTFGHSITIPVIRGKAANLILYRGTEPIISTNEEDKYLITNFNTNDKFNRKIKCEITYEGTSIESNIFDLWDYKNESYNVRIDSNIKPVIFYIGDNISNPIELTAVRTGGPEKNGPKHDFKFNWSYTEDSVGKIYKVIENDSTGDVEEIEVSADDDILKEKTIVLYLSQGSYETESLFIDKYVIRDTVKLQCDLFINDEVESYGSESQEVRVVQDNETIIETHYQYYVAGDLGSTKDSSGWNGVTFKKAFRYFPWTIDPSKIVTDSNWYGDWNIIDKNNSNATWVQDGLAKVTWDCTNENFASNTTEFNYKYEYETGAANTQALKTILDIELSPYQAIYVTNRRVWLEKQNDNHFLVGRQEEWSYPQILKAAKGGGEEDQLVQETIDKLNVFNSLTAGGRDQGMFFEDVYILTKDTTVQSGKKYYRKQYNADESFTYTEQNIVSGNPKEQFLYELKEDQVYINAEYIQTGALRVGDPERGHIFYADIDQQEVEIGGFAVDKDTLKSNDYDNLIQIFEKDDPSIIYSFSEELKSFNFIELKSEMFTIDYIGPSERWSQKENLKNYPILIIDVKNLGYCRILSLNNELLAEKIAIVIKGERLESSDMISSLIINVMGVAISELVILGDLFSKDSKANINFYYTNSCLEKWVLSGSCKTSNQIILEGEGHDAPSKYDYLQFAVLTSGFALSSNPEKNMIDSKNFKVNHDGTIHATNGEFKGTVRATGGEIGAFEITKDGLDSDFIKLNKDQIYFPEQSFFNLSDSVKIFSDNETGYIVTEGDRNFEIKNKNGAGIRFLRNEEFTSENRIMTLTSITREKYDHSMAQYGLAGVELELHFDFEENITLSPKSYDIFIELRYASGNNFFRFTYLDLIKRSFVIPQDQTGKFSISGITHYFEVGSSYNIGLDEVHYLVLEKEDDKLNNYFIENLPEGKDYITQSLLFDSNGEEMTSPEYKEATSEMVFSNFEFILDNVALQNKVLYSLGNFSPITPADQAASVGQICGSSNNPWYAVHAFTFDNESDKRLKNNICYNLDKYECFYNHLQPSSFHFTQDQKTTIGFIAQDVEGALLQGGLLEKDFKALTKGDQENYYTLSYIDFIALNTDQIQKLKKRESELENKVALLEQEIKEIKGEI